MRRWASPAKNAMSVKHGELGPSAYQARPRAVGWGRNPPKRAGHAESTAAGNKGATSLRRDLSAQSVSLAGA